MIDPRFLMGQRTQINPNIPVQKQVQAGDVLGGINQLMGQYQTGKALQGDQGALQALMMTNPQAAMQIQQNQANQQKAIAEGEAAKQKSSMDMAKLQSEAMEKFGKVLARAKTPEEAQQIHNQLLNNPIYAMINEKSASQGNTFDPSEDLLAVRAMYGSGYGDMELKEVVKMYRDQMPVRDLDVAKNVIQSVQNNYDRFLENPAKNISAGAAIGKQAIQLVETGVVRPEEAAQFAGVAIPANLSSESDIKDYVMTKLKGGLQKEQVDGLAQLAIDTYNAKVKNVLDIQENMRGSGLGQHPERIVFGTELNYVDNFVNNGDSRYVTGGDIVLKDPEGNIITSSDIQSMAEKYQTTPEDVMKRLQSQGATK